ncbi:MAG TPA: GNAT family N-acetyltransferase [Anaerovoracaceae bacterium]|nr:GNAT family N-acetyltransferase [Anaerovoracaceae bacterium]
MQYEETQIILKNGIKCILRSPGPKDAEATLFHLKQTAGETDYISRYPEEVTLTVEEEEAFLEKVRTDSKSMMISAVVDGKIVANAAFNCVLDTFKYHHRADLGIAVQQEYWNQGIGTAMLAELIKEAEKAGYEQLELEVDCKNEQAIKLYQKLGFRTYGTRERTFKLKGGNYSSFYLMLLCLR